MKPEVVEANQNGVEVTSGERKKKKLHFAVGSGDPKFNNSYPKWKQDESRQKRKAGMKWGMSGRRNENMILIGIKNQFGLDKASTRCKKKKKNMKEFNDNKKSPGYLTYASCDLFFLACWIYEFVC